MKDVICRLMKAINENIDPDATCEVVKLTKGDNDHPQNSTKGELRQ